MRTITLEEHFATPAFLDGPGRDLKEQAEKFDNARAKKLIPELCDLGDKRIAAMDAAGIDMQIVSLTAPGVEQLDKADAAAIVRDTNDFLAAAIKKNPKRIGGFAVLPTGEPEKAAQELERRVREQKFAGAVINGHHRGRYLDDKFFWPILESAEKLGVPIYLHPTKPPKAVIDASFGGFSPLVTEMFSGPGWGWHIETAVHLIRIILGGAFDRYPNLQIIIGHLGEGLAAMFRRVDIMAPEATKLKRPISAYLRDNVHYTISGFNYPATFLALLLELGGVDRLDVLGRPSLSGDGGRAGFPHAIAGQRRRPRAHRPRQCGEVVQVIKRRPHLAVRCDPPPPGDAATGADRALRLRGLRKPAKPVARPPSANCDTIQRVYQRKVHGIGTMKIHATVNSTERHNSPQPLAVNCNECPPPSTRRHIQRVHAVHTQAQPMMLNTETITSKYHPSSGQYVPVKRSGAA